MPTNTARRGYFDPLVLAKIANMSLRARHVVEGLLSGLHDSPYRGYSVEFAEHREYTPGDEIRHIDWKAYGKFDRYFIKEYEEETNLRAYLLVDASASMDYGSAGLSKFDYSCYLAASLAYLMLHQWDAVGLVTFNAQVQRYIPPRGGMQHMHALARHLEATRPQGETHLDQVLRELAGKLGRSSASTPQKLKGIKTKPAPISGAPILTDALGWVECRVVATLPAGDHTLVLGEVIEAGVEHDGHPLTLAEAGFKYSG